MLVTGLRAIADESAHRRAVAIAWVAAQGKDQGKIRQRYRATGWRASA